MSFFERHKLIKVLSLNAISVMIQFVLGIFSVRIVSEYLGASGMAFTGNFRSFTTLFKSISVLGLKEGLIKLFLEKTDQEEDRKSIVATFSVFFTLIALVLASVILLFSESFSKYLFQADSYSVYLQYFALLLPFFVLQTLLITLFNAEQAFRKIVIIQVITNILLFITSLYFIYQDRLEGAFFAIAIADFISFVVTVFFVRNQYGFSFKLKTIYLKTIYLKTIYKFIIMALISAIVIPLTAILIRNHIIANSSSFDAGIWEAINRISGFYMMFFSAGLSLYYLPKLSSITTDKEFKQELTYYFKILVPIFIGVLLLVYLFKKIIISIALTVEFQPVSDLLFWQLIGDLFRVMTLAFGFQILVKAMVLKYIIIEIIYNGLFILLSFFLFEEHQVEGVLQAYVIANIVIFFIILFMFRNLFFKLQTSKNE